LIISSSIYFVETAECRDIRLQNPQKWLGQTKMKIGKDDLRVHPVPHLQARRPVPLHLVLRLLARLALLHHRPLLLQLRNREGGETEIASHLKSQKLAQRQRRAHVHQNLRRYQNAVLGAHLRRPGQSRPEEDGQDLLFHPDLRPTEIVPVLLEEGLDHRERTEV